MFLTYRTTCLKRYNKLKQRKYIGPEKSPFHIIKTLNIQNEKKSIKIYKETRIGIFKHSKDESFRFQVWGVTCTTVVNNSKEGFSF